MNRHLVISSTLIGCLACSAFAQPQQQPKPDQTPGARVVLDLMLNDSKLGVWVGNEILEKKNDPNDKSLESLRRAYIRAADYMEPTEYLIGDALLKLKDAQISSSSAVQMSQVANTSSVKLQCLQVAQNGRIIQLLEYIAARMPKEKTAK